jgi:hypothetical protein
MPDLARLPIIPQTGGHPSDQSITLLGSLQKHRSTVGAALSLIKFQHRWLLKHLREQQTLCCGIL